MKITFRMAPTDYIQRPADLFEAPQILVKCVGYRFVEALHGRFQKLITHNLL